MSGDLIEQATAIADTDVEAMSLDLRSLVATFRSKVKSKDTRGAHAFARAIVKRAGREGIEAPTKSGGKPKKADLVAALEALNADRADEDKLSTSGTVPELEARLADAQS